MGWSENEGEVRERRRGRPEKKGASKKETPPPRGAFCAKKLVGQQIAASRYKHEIFSVIRHVMLGGPDEKSSRRSRRSPLERARSLS